MHFLLWVLAKVLELDCPLPGFLSSISFWLGTASLPECCLVIRKACFRIFNNLGVLAAGAGNLAFGHPRMILTATPANVLDGHTVLLLQKGLLSLACMYTCTAGHGGKESLAGKHTMCNILELLALILGRLCCGKDARQHVTLVATQ